MEGQENSPPGRIAIILPVHNEAETISQVVEEIDRTIGQRWPSDIFVFEDGSDDGTDSVLTNLQRSIPNLRVNTTRERKGYPTAVRDAIASIDPLEYPWMLFIDGDGQYDPRDFERLWDANPGNGTAIVLGGRMNRPEPLYRKLPSRALRRLEKLLFSPGCRDMTSAFRLMRTTVAQAIAAKVRFSPYNFWSEFTARASAMGHRQIEVPVSYRQRAGATKVYRLRKMPRIMWGELKALLRTWLEYKGAEVLRFGGVGLSGAVVILAGTWFLTSVLYLHYLLSAAIAIEVSILWAFFFNDRWTFRKIRSTNGVLVRLGTYNVVSLAGLGINLAVLYALTQFGGLHYLLSEFLAICVAFWFNYFASLQYAWRVDEAGMRA